MTRGLPSDLPNHVRERYIEGKLDLLWTQKVKKGADIVICQEHMESAIPRRRYPAGLCILSGSFQHKEKGNIKDFQILDRPVVRGLVTSIPPLRSVCECKSSIHTPQSFEQLFKSALSKLAPTFQ